MVEPLSAETRLVLYYGIEEADRLGDSHVSTEHLLLGLLRCESAWTAHAALEFLDVPPAKLRSAVGEGRALGPAVEGEKELSPAGKRVIDLAVEERRRLGDDAVAPEHLLLGLFAEAEGVAARVLRGAGLDLPGLRAEVIRLQGKPAAPGGFLGRLKGWPRPGGTRPRPPVVATEDFGRSRTSAMERRVTWQRFTELSRRIVLFTQE